MYVRGCGVVVMPFDVDCLHFQVVFVRFSLPLGFAVSIWDCHGCVCPVIEVFHNERAALPMSVDGLRMSRECIVIFAFKVNKLPAASPSVDPNPFVGPCEYFIPMRVINDIPCCWCFAMFGSCSGGFCQWVSLSSCCSCLFAIPFVLGREVKNVASRIKHSRRLSGSQRVANVM